MPIIARYNNHVSEVFMHTKKFQAAAAQVPKICMPKSDVDLSTWAVVACDQFTSEPEYWNEVEALVGDSPSSLHLVLPEIYLEAPDADERIKKIHNTMKEYLDNGTLEEQEEALHLIRRKPVNAPERWGILLNLDLEQYDYRPGSTSLIRATEGTIVERIPPRLRIREEAPVELPHILVLIDDPENVVMGPLVRHLDESEKIYDFTLMKDGGDITGWRVSSPELLDRTANGLNLLSGSMLDSENNQMLYAVGDGNHSLATAKAYWEGIKEAHSGDPSVMGHPARWALVEIENIHDPGLVFEPIHRALFHVDTAVMESYFSQVCDEWKFVNCSSIEEALQMVSHGVENGHVAGFTDSTRTGCYIFRGPKSAIPVGTLQQALDMYIAEHSSVSIDYIHGEQSALQLGRKPGNCAFFLPSIDKYTFFRTIEIDGALPRKTFSMGEAEEKRYYLESRKIT